MDDFIYIFFAGGVALPLGLTVGGFSSAQRILAFCVGLASVVAAVVEWRPSRKLRIQGAERCCRKVDFYPVHSSEAIAL